MTEQAEATDTVSRALYARELTNLAIEEGRKVYEETAGLDPEQYRRWRVGVQHLETAWLWLREAGVE